MDTPDPLFLSRSTLFPFAVAFVLVVVLWHFQSRYLVAETAKLHQMMATLERAQQSPVSELPTQLIAAMISILERPAGFQNMRTESDPQLVTVRAQLAEETALHAAEVADLSAQEEAAALLVRPPESPPQLARRDMTFDREAIPGDTFAQHLVPPHPLASTVEAFRDIHLQMQRLIELMRNDLAEATQQVLATLVVADTPPAEAIPVAEEPLNGVPEAPEYRQYHPSSPIQPNCIPSAICFETLTANHPVAVPCGHIFHEACLAPLRTAGALCPLCRRSTAGPVIRLLVFTHAVDARRQQER